VNAFGINSVEAIDAVVDFGLNSFAIPLRTIARCFLGIAFKFCSAVGASGRRNIAYKLDLLGQSALFAE